MSRMKLGTAMAGVFAAGLLFVAAQMLGTGLHAAVDPRARGSA